MEQNSPIELAVVLASTREGRLAPVIARWFIGECKHQPEFRLTLLDLAEFGLPDTLSRKPSAAVSEFQIAVAHSDAFVIVTPEYNHSFPAPLKTAIDWTSNGWAAKPVAFVSYGGNSGGLRAVEQLRLVFIELHAAPIRASVSFHLVWEHFNHEGAPKEPEKHRKPVTGLLNELRWWGKHLRAARVSEPFIP